jgi:hypothetical protein
MKKEAPFLLNILAAGNMLRVSFTQLISEDFEFPVKGFLTYQYSRSTICYFVFGLLRINSLNMFRVLLAHHQEALHKQLVYCVRIMSDGATRVGVELLSPKFQ